MGGACSISYTLKGITTNTSEPKCHNILVQHQDHFCNCGSVATLRIEEVNIILSKPCICTNPSIGRFQNSDHQSVIITDTSNMRNDAGTHGKRFMFGTNVHEKFFSMGPDIYGALPMMIYTENWIFFAISARNITCNFAWMNFNGEWNRNQRSTPPKVTVLRTGNHSVRNMKYGLQTSILEGTCVTKL